MSKISALPLAAAPTPDAFLAGVDRGMSVRIPIAAISAPEAAAEALARAQGDQAEATARAQALAAEATAREQADALKADATLGNVAAADKIVFFADEVAARAQGDQAEASARAQADQAEAATRAQADQAEATARAQADQLETAQRVAGLRALVTRVAAALGLVESYRGPGDRRPLHTDRTGSAFLDVSASTAVVRGRFGLQGVLQFPARALQHYGGLGDRRPLHTDRAGSAFLDVSASTGVVRGRFGLHAVLQSAARALQNYGGPGDRRPLHTDRAGSAFLDVSASTAVVRGRFGLHAVLQSAARALQLYGGGGDRVPLHTDRAGSAFLELEIPTGELHGRFGLDDSRPLPLTTSFFPLAAADVPLLADWNGVHASGESLSVGYGGTPPISTVSPYQNLTFGSGTKSAPAGNAYGATNTAPGTSTVIPLVESTSADDGYPTQEGETTCAGMANWATQSAMVEHGVALTCLASTAGHGGYRISSIQKAGPTSWYTLLTDQIGAAAALARQAGRVYAAQVVALVIGHNNAILATNGEHDDGSLGQTPGNARAEFLAGLRSWWTAVQADAPAASGQGGPLHLLMYQTASLIVPSQGAIALAQADFIGSAGPRVHFVRPIYDLPYIADGTHMTALGYLRLGRAHGRAVMQLLIEQRAPDCVWPIAAVGSGSAVRVRYQVPRLPLRLDLVGLAPTQDCGFQVRDAGGVVPVSSLQVVGGDQVQITLARPLQGAWVVRYAMDYLGQGLNVVGGASGNLRDSTPGSYRVGGVSYPDWHPAPHHQTAGFTLDPNS